MATIEEGLISFIESNVASAGKGYPLLVPQDAAYPAWSYEVTTEEQTLTHSGPAGWYEVRVTVLFIGTTYALARAAADALRSALDGYVGAMGTRTVQYCHVSNQSASWADLHDMPAARLDLILNYV
jgi:hypothetical protein